MTLLLLNVKYKLYLRFEIKSFNNFIVYEKFPNILF